MKSKLCREKNESYIKEKLMERHRDKYNLKKVVYEINGSENSENSE
jgi:hypothetical protein